MPMSDNAEGSDRSTPGRFEFRFWGTDLSVDRRSLFADLVPENEPIEDCIYLIAPHVTRHNIKIRGGKLEIKKLIEKVGFCERWKPVFRNGFPLGATRLNREFTGALGIGQFEPDFIAESADRLIEFTLERCPDAVALSVHKDRTRYRDGELLAEHACVEARGNISETIAIESGSYAALDQYIKRHGLNTKPNRSYPEFLNAAHYPRSC